MRNFTAFVFIGSAFVLGAYLDGSASLDALGDSLSLNDAQRAAQAAYKKELRAARLCREELGEGTTIQWTASGELVCIPTTKGVKK